MNGSPSRPRAPVPGLSAPSVASTSVIANLQSFGGSRPAAERVKSTLSLFDEPSQPGSPLGHNRVVSQAPSTIGSVFDSSTGIQGGTRTVSPGTAHSWTETLTEVRDAARQFSDALGALSSAADTLGHALEKASQQKPVGDAAEGVSVSGSLHMLISNHLQILQSTIVSKLCRPLEDAVKEYSHTLKERESHFRGQLKQAKAILAETEARNKAASRNRNRDLTEYRTILLDMTAQIDDINRLKYEFLCDLYAQGNAQAETLKGQLGQCIGAELEIFESIGRKGWSGGGLDAILQEDPFDSNDRQQFTMLARLTQDDVDEDDGDTTIRDDTLGLDDEAEPGAAAATANILDDL